MAVDLLNRRISFVAVLFAFVGVVLGVVALSTNYWSVEQLVTPGTALQTPNGTVLTNENIEWTWNGLFYQCGTGVPVQCVSRFWSTTFIICLLGVIFLFVGGVFMCWDAFQITDRRFVIPFLFFVACVLLTAGVFDYGSWARLNSHSSRAMIAATVFAYAALPLSAFIAGRYSAFERFAVNGQKYVGTATNGN